MRALADTSFFIAEETGRLRDGATLPAEMAVSVITIGELRVGVLAAVGVDVRDRRLRTLSRALQLDPVPVDQPVGDAWARLRVLLRDAGRRMSVNDSWIAATALAHSVPIMTQDSDYDDVPGLEIVRV